MADDNLFDDKDQKPAVKDKSAADPNTDRLARLEQGITAMGGNLEAFAEKIVGALNVQRAAPVTQPQNTPTAIPSNDDLVQELLTDPTKALGRVLESNPHLLDKLVTDRIVKDVGPWVQNDVLDKHEAFRADARQRIDQTYGPGTWEEVLAPEVEAIFKSLDAQGGGIGRGVRKTFDAVLRQASGDPATIEKLWDRKNDYEKKRQQTAPEMLDGLPAPRQKTQLSDQDKAFQRRYEETTGYKLDSKKLLDILERRRQNDEGVWTAESMGSKNRLQFGA